MAAAGLFAPRYFAPRYFPPVWFAPGDESHLTPEERAPQPGPGSFYPLPKQRQGGKRRRLYDINREQLLKRQRDEDLVAVLL